MQPKRIRRDDDDGGNLMVMKKFSLTYALRPHHHIKTEDIGCENHAISGYLIRNQALTLILHYQLKWCP
jgi:hypothetical protein